MTSTGVVSRELQSSVRDALGSKVKAVSMRRLRVELKPDKLDERILVMSPCRMYLMSAKIPRSQVEMTFHFLDIQAIESKKPNQLWLTVKDKSHHFQSMDVDSSDVDDIILHITTAIKAVFPLVPLEKIIRQIDVVPVERLKVMQDTIKDLETKEAGPCGGYSHMYACMCDYYDLRHQEEVAWDIDTIYLSHDSRELCLGDFDHLDNKDLVPIIAALEFNQWFTSFRANGTKLNSDLASKILTVMMRGSSIEELHLSGVGLGRDFAEKLSTALLSNTLSPLIILDLSKNSLEDRGLVHLSGPVSHLSKGLSHLNLSKTGVMGKGVNKLCDAMSQNKFMATTLQFLDLSDNSLAKGEEPTTLYNFLAQPNALTHLKLSSSGLALDTIIAPISRGCTSHLRDLDLSNNTFTLKKNSDVPQAWKQFFSSALSLKHVNLAGNRLPDEAVKQLLLGISVNKQLQELTLNLSNNELKTTGAQVLGGCIADIQHLSSLDISDNGFDAGLKNILPWVCKNKSLRHLFIGKNFGGLKSKSLAQVLDAIVDMMQDEDCQLQSLSLADSKLRLESHIVIGALGSNSTLTHFDVSGNQMGDFGARMLAKALMINTRLQEIYWDGNNTSAQGFEDVAVALEKNFAVRIMPTPIQDAAEALKSHPDRTRIALEKIETCLHRNHSPRKFATEQAYRLQQGFLISATQQLVDKLMVQVQDTVDALVSHPKNDGDADMTKDVQLANKLITDADNSKQLLPKLQQVAIQSECEGNNVEVKLRSLAKELQVVLEDQLKKNVTDMVHCAEERCPVVLGDDDTKSKMLEICKEKSGLPGDFSHALIVDQIGTDVMNKVSEVNLAVASYVSDEVNDGVLDSLTNSHKILTNHLNELRKRTEANQEKPQRQSVDSMDSQGPEEFVLKTPDDDRSEPVTPRQNKRISVMDRRTRPKSCIRDAGRVVVDIDINESKPVGPAVDEVDEGTSETPESLPKSPSVGEDKDADGEKVMNEMTPPSVKVVSPAKTQPKPEKKDNKKIVGSASLEFEAIAPSQTLHSVTKDRPRMQKRTRPTRRPDAVPSIAQDVDSFYTKMDGPVEPEVVPAPKEVKVDSDKKQSLPAGNKEGHSSQAPDTKPKPKSGFSISGLFHKKDKKKESVKTQSPPKSSNQEAKSSNKTPELPKKKSTDAAKKTPETARKVAPPVAEKKTDEVDGVETKAPPVAEHEPQAAKEEEKKEEVKEVSPRKPFGIGMPGMVPGLSMDVLKAKRETMKSSGLARNNEAAKSDKKAMIPPTKLKPRVSGSHLPSASQTTLPAEKEIEPPAGKLPTPSSSPLEKRKSDRASKGSTGDTSGDSKQIDAVEKPENGSVDVTPPAKSSSGSIKGQFKLPTPTSSPLEKRKSDRTSKGPTSDTSADAVEKPEKGTVDETPPVKPSSGSVKGQFKLPSPAELFKTADSLTPPKPSAKPRSSAALDATVQPNGETKKAPPPLRPKPAPPTKPKPAVKPRSSTAAPETLSSVDADKSGVVRPTNRQSVQEIRERIDNSGDKAGRSATLPKGSSVDTKVEIPVRPASTHGSNRKSSLDEFKRIQREVRDAEATVSQAEQKDHEQVTTVSQSDGTTDDSQSKEVGETVEEKPEQVKKLDSDENAKEVQAEVGGNDEVVTETMNGENKSKPTGELEGDSNKSENEDFVMV